MVARSFGGTPRRRPTSPSTRDAGGAPRSSARRFVTRRNPSIIPRLDAPFSRDFVSFTHTRARRYANKTCIACPNPIAVGPARPREPTPTLSFRFQALSGFARACGTPRRAREGRRIERRIDRRSTFLRPNRESFTRDTREGTREHRLGGVVGASLLCDPSLC